MRDTRTAVIVHHLQIAARHTGATMESILCDAVDLYHARTPLHARTVDFAAGGDPYTARRTNSVHLRRMLGLSLPHSKLPADLEEAIVLALPEPMQTECLRELSARYGLLAVADPGSDTSPDASALARRAAAVMTETADTLAAVANLVDDGVLDRTDLANIDTALAEVNQGIAEMHAMRAALATTRDRVAGQGSAVRQQGRAVA